MIGIFGEYSMKISTIKTKVIDFSGSDPGDMHQDSCEW